MRISMRPARECTSRPKAMAAHSLSSVNNPTVRTAIRILFIYLFILELELEFRILDCVNGMRLHRKPRFLCELEEAATALVRCTGSLSFCDVCRWTILLSEVEYLVKVYTCALGRFSEGCPVDLDDTGMPSEKCLTLERRCRRLQWSG